MRTLIKFLHSIRYYFLLIIGIVIVLWIIWARFIRVRLPKDIPFDLTEVWFYILLYICCIYLYIIISLLISREANPVIAKFIKVLYTPLVILDEAIKNNQYFSKNYNKLLAGIINRFDNLTFNQMQIICCIYQILPRILLTVILLFDVFFMHKLELIYSFILLGIFPLIHRYIKYSLKYAKEQFLKHLSHTYDMVWVLDKNYTNADWEYNSETMMYHNMEITIEEYLNIQTKTLGIEEVQYQGSPYAKEEVYLEYKLSKYGTREMKLTSDDYNNIAKEFHNTMPKLLKLSIFLERYSLIEKAPIIKYTKVFIYSIYFICWSSILLVSYKKIEVFTLANALISWLTPYIEKIEPFSGTLL
jgi:hypothetical protein